MSISTQDIPRDHVRRPRARTLIVTLVFIASTTVGHLVAAGQDSIESTLSGANDHEGADVIGAFKDSLKLLLLEHGSRIAFQSKTRRELAGNFWTDYRRSVRIPDQWGDTDAWWINYVGHPVHGAAAGYIWLDHEPGAPAGLQLDGRYWSSRGRAMAWSAAYSLQFEIGPLSEASIGNVGMRPETTGWVDHVVTPLGAFGLIVAEDALDRFVAKRVEGRMRNPILRGVVRVLLNPGRSLSNASTGQLPWHRDDRPLDWH